jgi:hypothetical protein
MAPRMGIKLSEGVAFIPVPTGSSSGDEEAGEDFASADLWAARIEAAERGKAAFLVLCVTASDSGMDDD